MDEILTLPEVARLLKVSESQVRRLVKDSGLPTIQIATRRALRFNRESVLKWLEKYEWQRK